MALLRILLRLIRIFAGVFWAGGTFMVVGFLYPAVKASGPEGQRFMQRLVQQQKYSLYISLAAVLSALAGLVLYWRDSGGLRIGWITTGLGLALTIGSLAGIVTLLLGFVVTRPTSEGLAARGQEIQAGSKPPTPEQMARIQGLQKRLSQALIWSTVLLAIAVAGMSVARSL